MKYKTSVLLWLGVFTSFHAFSADGKISFTGSIIDSACTVTNNESSPLAVNLGKISKTAFNDSNKTAAATKFTIQLINCPDTVKSASVKFDGKPLNGDNSIIALTSGTGVASGVGIQLTDSSQNILSLSQDSTPYTLTKDSVNNLDFIARYVSTATEVTPGKADAEASFTINYN